LRPLSTSSTAAQPTPQLFCIHPGQAHALVVPAGSELFCSHGSLLLHSGPQGLVDGAPSLQWQLSTGQRWRALPAVAAGQQPGWHGPFAVQHGALARVGSASCHAMAAPAGIAALCGRAAHGGGLKQGHGRVARLPM
jgi:hypothetical protein